MPQAPTAADIKAFETEAADALRETLKDVRVLLAYPCDRSVPQQFADALGRVLTSPLLAGKITPLPSPGVTIHLQRDDLIKEAIKHDFTHLCMVDSDQTPNGMTLPRLLAWNVPVVAPVIVQRQGDPIPVAYKLPKEGWSEPQFDPIAAYVSQFDPKWYDNKVASVLPLVPDHEPQMRGIPADILEGLGDPLLPVDAVGAGMVVVRTDVLKSLGPAPWCEFTRSQGEDFSLCEKIRNAGWGGAQPGPKGWGIFVDRGCHVGHLYTMVRTVADMLAWMEIRQDALDTQAAEEAKLPPATELAEAVKSVVNVPRPWRAQALPEVVGA
jgi:hypothetical protein